MTTKSTEVDVQAFVYRVQTLLGCTVTILST